MSDAVSRVRLTEEKHRIGKRLPLLCFRFSAIGPRIKPCEIRIPVLDEAGNICYNNNKRENCQKNRKENET